MWAHQAIQTRSWHLRKNSSDPDSDLDIAMVPWADMLNHKPTAHQGHIAKNSFYFQIRAAENYSPGQQAYDSYGDKGNLRLLLGYGFVLENNTHDYAEIKMSLNDHTG
jgi:protein-histidine N-methyltransferase